MTSTFQAMTRRSLLLSLAMAGPSLMLANQAQSSGSRKASFDFFVLGDWGRSGTGGQRSVADAMTRIAKDKAPDSVMTVGDNFYFDGVKSVADDQWAKKFEGVYNSPQLQCPWYAVLGNHDWDGNVEAEIAYHNVDGRWNMPSRFYKVSKYISGRANIDLFFLDTTPIKKAHNRTEESENQLKWLETELKASTATWKVAFGHHPIYSSGRHRISEILFENVRPLLENHGVQAYFCGHDHHMEHLARDGVHYFVAGSAATTKPLDPDKLIKNRPDFVATELGFAVVNIGADRMSVKFVSASAASLFETEFGNHV